MFDFERILFKKRGVQFFAPLTLFQNVGWKPLTKIFQNCKESVKTLHFP